MAPLLPTPVLAQALVRISDGPLYAHLLGGGEPRVDEALAVAAVLLGLPPGDLGPIDTPGDTLRRCGEVSQALLAPGPRDRRRRREEVSRHDHGGDRPWPGRAERPRPDPHARARVRARDRARRRTTATRWWDEEARVADAVEKLERAHGQGDHARSSTRRCGASGATSPGSSGSPRRRRLNIVVATGLYAYGDLPQQYAYRGPGLLLDMPEPLVAGLHPRHRRGHRRHRRQGGLPQVLRGDGGPDAGRRADRPRGRAARARRPARRSPCTPAPTSRAAGRRSTCSRPRAPTSPRSSSGTPATATTSTT